MGGWGGVGLGMKDCLWSKAVQLWWRCSVGEVLPQELLSARTSSQQLSVTACYHWRGCVGCRWEADSSAGCTGAGCTGPGCAYSLSRPQLQ